jgi:hypothetical protein
MHADNPMSLDFLDFNLKIGERATKPDIVGSNANPCSWACTYSNCTCTCGLKMCCFKH